MKLLKITIFCLGIIHFFPLNAQNYNNAIIGFYNLENLFDTINDPNKNDEEFLPNGKNQWNSEKYFIKLKNMADVISLIGQDYGGWVVLGVSEVENQAVLEDLIIQDKLKPLKLKVAHHDSPDKRGVDVSFLYNPERFEFISLKAFPLVVPNKPDFISRDQVLMTGVLDKKDTLFIIVNHWPSKSGGEARSAPGRNAAGVLSKHICDSIFAIHPNANIIIMGDLNADPIESCITKELGAIGKIKNLTPQKIYNPMYPMFQEGIGSLAYQDNWNLFDQIMVSYNLVTPNSSNYYKFSNAYVFRKSFMINKSGSFTGYPFRTFAGGSFIGGYSDHLPVYIILQKK
jgi:hypothetical protein